MFFIRLQHSPVDSLLHHVTFSHKQCCITHGCSVFLPGSPTGREALSPGWQPLRAEGCTTQLPPAARCPLLQRQQSPFQPQGEKKPAIPVGTSLKILHFSQFPFIYKTTKQFLEVCACDLFEKNVLYSLFLRPGRFLQCQTCSEYS